MTHGTKQPQAYLSCSLSLGECLPVEGAAATLGELLSLVDTKASHVAPQKPALRPSKPVDHGLLQPILMLMLLVHL